MIPFRVLDKETKQIWQVINYHPGSSDQGSYLASKENDDSSDGDMRIIKAEELAAYKFIDFIEEVESFET